MRRGRGGERRKEMKEVKIQRGFWGLEKKKKKKKGECWDADVWDSLRMNI